MRQRRPLHSDHSRDKKKTRYKMINTAGMEKLNKNQRIERILTPVRHFLCLQHCLRKYVTLTWSGKADN